MYMFSSGAGRISMALEFRYQSFLAGRLRGH